MFFELLRRNVVLKIENQVGLWHLPVTNFFTAQISSAHDAKLADMNSLQLTYKLARRIAIAIVGTTVLLVGVVMIVIPGPAIVVIPLGLAILGIEFAWARMWLRKIRKTISSRNQKDHGERAEEYRQR